MVRFSYDRRECKEMLYFLASQNPVPAGPRKRHPLVDSLKAVHVANQCCSPPVGAYTTPRQGAERIVSRSYRCKDTAHLN